MATLTRSSTKPGSRPQKVASKSPGSHQKPSNGESSDAIVLLRADHAEVKKRFTAYQKLVEAQAPGDERQKLAEEICMMLTVHATIEEEIFYPAAREVLGDDAAQVDEADVEHASAKELIAQIRAMAPGDQHYDAKMKVLGEYIDHHVKEEQDELFPDVKKAGLDTKALGVVLGDRKTELMAELEDHSVAQ